MAECKSLLLSVIVFLTVTSTAYGANGRHRIHLFRRSDTGAYTRVQVGDLDSLDPSTVAKTARNAQINYVGELAENRNITQWISYKDELTTKYFENPDPATLATDSPLAPVARVLVIGLVMILLSVLGTCCFCCCRCCNQCGGRKPSPEGYSKRQIIANAVLFLSFSVLVVAFIALNYSYSVELSQAPEVGKKGVLALLDSADEFVENTKGGLSASPDAIVSSANTLINRVLTIDFPLILNETFDPVVNLLVSDVVALGTQVNSGKSLLNSSAILVNSIKTRVQQIPPILSSISLQMAALSSFKVQTQAQNYSFTVANLPDISALTNVSLPDTSAIDISSVVSSLDAVPNLAQIATDLQATYKNITRDLPNTANETLSQFTSDPKAKLNDTLFSLNSSLTTGGQASIREVRSSVQTQYDSFEVQKYTTYITQTFLGEVAIVCIPIIIALLGAILKHPGAMHTFTCIMFVVPILLWLQFLIFYMTSLPLNVVCNNVNYMISADYDVAGLLKTDIGISDLSINPGVLLDGCRAGKSLFDSPINTAGKNVATYIRESSSSIVNKSGLNSMLDKQKFKDMVKMANLSTYTDIVSGAKLDSFNVSSLNIPSIQLNFSTASVVQDMNTTVYNLRPDNFDPVLGNVTLMQGKITQFNSDCQSEVPSFAGWTYTYISTTYAQSNSPVFDPVTISANPGNNAMNGRISGYFATMFPSVAFFYQCDQQLTLQKQKVNNLTTTILGLQNNQINGIQSDINQLQGNVQNVTTVINATIAAVNVLVGDIPKVSIATDAFIDRVIAEVTNLTESAINIVVDTVLLNNPVAGFGSCQALAESFEYTKGSVCQTLTNGLSGIWFCSMLTGIFLIPACVFSIRTKKRVEYLGLAHKVSDSNGKTNFKAPDVIEGEAEVGDILKSAPVIDAEYDAPQSPEVDDQQLSQHDDEKLMDFNNVNAPEYDGQPFASSSNPDIVSDGNEEYSGYQGDHIY